MARLDIRIYGDPVLREKAREVTPDEINENFRRLIADMGETMYDANGIGLAGNQVGELRRVFVADWDQVKAAGKGGRRQKDPDRRNLRVFLNPRIEEFSAEDEEGNEGCLSIPEVEADVYRALRIRVRYRTMEWEEKEEWLEELAARVFQHELDHLDGILFIDRLGEARRSQLAGVLNRLKRGAERSAVASASRAGEPM